MDPPEQPWTAHEKNYLLAEIIKAANPPANVLFDVIRSLNIQPRWEDTPLPPGRSLNSSRYAFEDMRRSLSLPVGANIATQTPTPLSGPITLKRPYQYEGSYSAGGSGGREIRPKLQPTNASTVYVQPSPTEHPPKRKRGRPTKAEALAKAEAAAGPGPAGGRPGPMTIPRPSAQMTPQPQPGAPRRPSTGTAEEVKTATTRMPIAAMLTPTAREPKSASHSHSSSSSGKRHRARSTKSQPEESPVTRSSVARQEYESPYARADAPDTPARAAVLRHREDPLNLPRTAPSEEPSGPPTEPTAYDSTRR